MGYTVEREGYERPASRKDADPSENSQAADVLPPIGAAYLPRRRFPVTGGAAPRPERQLRATQPRRRWVP